MTRKSKYRIFKLLEAEDTKIIIKAYLSGSDGLNVASGLSRQIDNNAAGLHVVNHVLLNQYGGLSAGDQGGGDDNVNILNKLN